MTQPLGLGFVIALLLAASGLANLVAPEADDTVVVRVEADFSARRRDLGAAEAALGNLVADAIVDEVRAHGRSTDCAILPAWVFGYDSLKYRDGTIPAGDLTRASLRKLVRFNAPLAVVEMTGEELRHLLEKAIPKLPAGGFFQVSRELRVVIDREGRKVVSLSMAGQPMDEDATYLVASINEAWGGWNSSKATVLHDAPKAVDAFAANTARIGVIAGVSDGRLTFVR